jgi:hypothetical protein
MDYSHRHPESVSTSYPTAFRFSVSGGGHRHQCLGTMCWPCPGYDVGNPYRSVALGSEMLRCAQHDRAVIHTDSWINVFNCIIGEGRDKSAPTDDRLTDFTFIAIPHGLMSRPLRTLPIFTFISTGLLLPLICRCITGRRCFTCVFDEQIQAFDRIFVG